MTYYHCVSLSEALLCEADFCSILTIDDLLYHSKGKTPYTSNRMYWQLLQNSSFLQAIKVRKPIPAKINGSRNVASGEVIEDQTFKPWQFRFKRKWIKEELYKQK